MREQQEVLAQKFHNEIFGVNLAGDKLDSTGALPQTLSPSHSLTPAPAERVAPACESRAPSPRRVQVTCSSTFYTRAGASIDPHSWRRVARVTPRPQYGNRAIDPHAL